MKRTLCIAMTIKIDDAIIFGIFADITIEADVFRQL